MKLGEVITKYRQDNDLSMREFARRAELSATYVSYLEKGESCRGKNPVPSIETYKAVAMAMNIGLEELLAKVDDLVQVNSPRIPTALPAPYTPEEQTIIDIYRSLSEQGKSYIKEQLHVAELLYQKNIPSAENVAE